MKGWKKTGIIGMMAVTVLAGCSGGGTPEASKPAEGTQTSPAASEPSAGGKPVKITVAMSDALNKYALASSNISASKWVKKLGELTNTELDIRLLPHADIKSKIALMFASKDIPDVVHTIQGMYPVGTDMIGAVKGGKFLALDDLLAEHGQDILKAVPEEAWDEVRYNGKIYAIPEYLSVQSRRATFIRKDLLDATGLPVPQTVDDFLNVLRALKKNGVQQPYAFREKFAFSDVIFGAYDVLPYSTMYEKIDDQIVPKFFKVEAMQKALQVYKTMYDEGLIAKDFANVDGNRWTNDINTGKSAVWNHNGNLMANWVNSTKAASPDAVVSIIPSPVGDDGQGGMTKFTYTGGLTYINSEVGAEKAAAIMKFLNFQITEAGDRFFNFGIEGDTYTVQDGKVSYKHPETPEETYEESFRSSIFRFVEDQALNRTLLSTSETGRTVIEQFDSIVTKEGREGISFLPELEASAKHPDVGMKFSDMPPLILDHMLKMIYGKEPISDWPKVIEEWKAKGGNDIIKEATDRYNAKDGVKIAN
ncbi:ABC transporter substrate-binding protein [Cohnella sp.]|uniref:ABC transporter substrate-binding protein n=1 Tax=Cohnella sp. TaxID=1883426 RepID=UPI0035614FC2